MFLIGDFSPLFNKRQGVALSLVISTAFFKKNAVFFAKLRLTLYLKAKMEYNYHICNRINRKESAMEEYEITLSAQEAPDEQYDAANSQETAAPKKPKKSGRLFIAVIAAALVCAGIAAATVILLTKSDELESNINPDDFSSALETNSETAEMYANTKFAPKYENRETVKLSSVSSEGKTILGDNELYKRTEKFTVNLFCFDQNQVRVASKWATGTVITPDGYIATNAHVYSNCTNIIVQFADGREYEAAFVGKDDLTDLAVIKIDAQNLDCAQFGATSEIKVGDNVAALGNAGGFSWTFTKGIVSAESRKIDKTPTPYSIAHIQFDAAVNTGNSGGPVVNYYGQLVGIVDSKYVADSAEGLGFAISANEAIPILEELIEKGEINTRVKIGFTYQQISAQRAAITGQKPGLYVVDIASGKPVASSGLQKGDTVIKIDGTDAGDDEAFREIIKSKRPNDAITLTVDRNGEEHTFTTTVTAYDE